MATTELIITSSIKLAVPTKLDLPDYKLQKVNVGAAAKKDSANGYDSFQVFRVKILEGELPWLRFAHVGYFRRGNDVFDSNTQCNI